MNSGRPWKLLAAISALLAMAVFGLQALFLVQGARRDLDFMAIRAANRSQATANQVQAICSRVDLLLQEVRDQMDPGEVGPGPGVRTGARAASMRDLLNRLQARVPMVRQIQVVAADGRCVYSTFERVPDVSIADRAYFQEQREARVDRTVVSTPLQGRVSGRWGIYLSRRLVRADGAFAGLVLAGLDTEDLNSAMTTVDQGHWVFTLYHRDGTVVAHQPARRELTGTRPADFRRFDPGRPGPQPFRGPGLTESEPHLFALSAVPGYPLCTLAGYPRSVALAQWRNDLEINLTAGAALLLACAGIAGFYLRSMRAHVALVQSEAHYRAIFDAAPNPMALVAEEGILDVNPNYRDLFQKPGGRPCLPWDLETSGEEAREGAAFLEETLGQGQAMRLFHLQDRQGRTFEAEVTGTSFERRGRSCAIVVVRDLTPIRSLEEQLRQSQKLEALGQLAGGVAHDFNNMLGAIFSSAEILQLRVQDPALLQVVGVIASAADRAAQLTRHLLDFARRGKVLSTPVDIHDILRETLAILERTLDRRIQVDLRTGPFDALVVGDPSQLGNAFLNLALNARDAMPGGGRLLFETSRVEHAEVPATLGLAEPGPAGFLHLRVVDTGSGIPPEVLPRIFDPFFTTKSSGKGTGLGLSSVYGTLASHHGGVQVESTLGEGTTIHLYLPLTDAARVARAEARSAPLGGSGKILVVDDEEFMRTSTALILHQLGYEAVTECDPRAGVAWFEAHHEELTAVILDMVMPGMTGMEAALAMKAAGPEVPLILASGFNRDFHVQDVLGSVLAGNLQKPYTLRELGDLLAKVGRKRGA
jgi:signal transduction histidine kinase